ncbi:MASE1 domain-containing protein [Argonema antarcticum]|uniref:MASE1 domain-containing protein n=1 Tax=Argonema antarcticum TaxID=2942763 RepID=UPI002013561F|nr:MASE1 domain-containing protein [Argonema antarcticum]
MSPMPIRFWRYFVTVAMLAAVYGGTGKLALLIPSIVPQVTPLYPPAGISQAALLLLGLEFWPGVALGDFFVSLSTGAPPIVAFAMGAIASIQALTGSILLKRCKVNPNLERLQDVLGFVTLSVMLSTTIGPTLGVPLLCLNNIQPWRNFGTTWWTWWLGDGMGVLVVMPVFLTWCTGKLPKRIYWPQMSRKPQRYMDAGILLILLIVVSWVIFTSQTRSAIAHYPLEYLPFPLVVWVAFRFAQRGTVLANLFLCGIAIWGAAQGSGPFQHHTENPIDAVISLQAFITVVGITALLLAATVTERQQAQESLRSSQASLADAQRIAHIGSWNFDLIEQQWYWSEELYRILGFSPHAFEANYETFLRSVHDEDRDWVKKSLTEALKQQKSYSINYRIIRSDGQERIIREQAEIILDATGMPIRITGTVQDITKQKRVEQALIQSEAQLLELAHNLDLKVQERTEQLQQKNQELAHSLKTLQEAQQQLIQSEKMSSLGSLVAGIAHEINNPVNFIYGNLTHVRNYTEGILDLISLYQEECQHTNAKIKDRIESIDLEFVKADLPKILSSIEAGADRIRKIVLSLRNFSRLDEAQMKQVDIHEGIENTLLLLQQRLKSCHGHTGISAIKKYGELPLVECYPGQLNQVFMNLLTNAIDAIECLPQPGAITIYTQMLESNRVLIKIADTGSGMTPTVQARIFDPFFTTKPVGKGTGLGLSISYQIIVQHHKGQLKCISEPGKGTEFEIEIPLRQSR